MPAAQKVPGELHPGEDFMAGERRRAGEARGLRRAQVPEPIPERMSGLRHFGFRTVEFESFVALAPGLAVLVAHAIVAAGEAYGCGETFGELLIKFARSSEAAATWS